MPEAAAKTEILRSLGRLVRGLSALFWGLPIALIVCVWTAFPQWTKSFGVVPPLVSTALLTYGLWQLGGFQKQERVWRVALERARLLSLINFGLSPFLYWWSRVPANEFFSVMIVMLSLGGVLFLGSLNLMLQRLGAMLPDETLRQEIKQFTPFNLNLLAATLLLGGVYFGLSFLKSLPYWLGKLVMALEHSSFWFLVLLVLPPLAMTMALIWKTKEVILENVFGN